MTEAAGLFTEERKMRENAREGSERLRIAILKCMGLLPPEPRRVRTYKYVAYRPVTNREMARIVTATARHFKINSKQVMANNRKHDTTVPRHIAMFVARAMHGFSYPKIGKHFGHADHTTALYAIRKVENTPNLLSIANVIINNLKQPVDIGDNSLKSPNIPANDAIEQGMNAQADYGERKWVA